MCVDVLPACMCITFVPVSHRDQPKVVDPVQLELRKKLKKKGQKDYFVLCHITGDTFYHSFSCLQLKFVLSWKALRCPVSHIVGSKEILRIHASIPEVLNMHMGFLHLPKRSAHVLFLYVVSSSLFFLLIEWPKKIKG